MLYFRAGETPIPSLTAASRPPPNVSPPRHVVTAGDKPSFRGDLAATALPEILATIHRHLVPGVIDVSRDGIVKRIFLRDGYVLFATSTDRQDSLGQHVVRRGMVSPVAAAELAKARDASSRRLGEVMVERRFLSPAQVYEAIREQIAGIVWSLFAWDQGEVAFQIGEFREESMVRIDLPLRQVILRGVQHVTEAKRLVARLGRKDTVYEPTFRPEDLIEIALDADEFRLLSLVNAKRSLYELCTKGPKSPGENGKILYAFQVLQLIRQRQEEAPAGGIKIKFRTESEGF